MMRLAFYAPLKPPEHPVPSGDRAMARALIRALEHTGAAVDFPCDVRSRDGVGDTAVQDKIIQRAQATLPDVITQGRSAGWRAWITYHNYYKAPDLIGPVASAALGIPYVLIEATRARKRLGGPWDRFAKAAEAASNAADVVFYFTQRDHEALAAYAPDAQCLYHLPPFLPRADLPAVANGTGLLAVGMMRVAAKLGSYALIAQTLAVLPSDTTLKIAGDGPARAQVTALMAPFGNRVTFLGECDRAALADAYASAGALIWPGVDEAFGIVYLEAQAHGLPVIAQDRPGVRDVLYPRAGGYPTVGQGAAGLAALAKKPEPAAHDIRQFVSEHHLLPAAAQTLAAGLEQAGVT